MASYLGNSTLQYLMHANNPWAEEAAASKGQVFRKGVYFEKDVDDETTRDFFSQLGTWKPHGSPIPKPLAPGKSLAGGKYVITQDAPDGQGRDQFSPGADYRRIGRSGGTQIWYRQASATGPTETSSAPPAAPLDTAAIQRARELADAAKSKYSSSIPSFGSGSDPYATASAYGRQMQDSLLNYQDWRNAEASAQTTEISEAGRTALARINFEVPDYKLPEWRDYLNPKKPKSSVA